MGCATLAASASPMASPEPGPFLARRTPNPATGAGPRHPRWAGLATGCRTEQRNAWPLGHATPASGRVELARSVQRRALASSTSPGADGGRSRASPSPTNHPRLDRPSGPARPAARPIAQRPACASGHGPPGGHDANPCARTSGHNLSVRGSKHPLAGRPKRQGFARPHPAQHPQRQPLGRLGMGKTAPLRPMV